MAVETVNGFLLLHGVAENDPIYIKGSAITAVQPTEDGTRVTGNSDGLWVREPATEILAAVAASYAQAARR